MTRRDSVACWATVLFVVALALFSAVMLERESPGWWARACETFESEGANSE